MITVNNEQEMQAYAKALGMKLTGGEVIVLIGDVGAGKTTFVKGLGQGLEIDEAIQSPSFTISRVYDARDNLQLAHYDFYRLTDPGIMADELRDTSEDSDTIVVIEWADIVQDALPQTRLNVYIESPSETQRTVWAVATDESLKVFEQVFE